MKSQLPFVAPEKPTVFNHHGIKRSDSYFWMRNRKDPDTMKFIHSENKYFENQMKPLASLKKKLFKEMKARIQENDSTYPSPSGPYEYYTEYKKGQQYPLEQRKRRGDTNNNAETILDHNVLAKGKKYLDVSDSAPCPQHRLLAYSVDFDGSEKYEIRIKDLTTGKELKDKVPNTNGGLVWAKDSLAFYYVELDSQQRPVKIKRHLLGSDPKKDETLYHEKNQEYFLDVFGSSSEDFIFAAAYGKTSSEIFYLSSHDNSAKLKLFQKRKADHEYFVDHHHDLGFLVRTNFRSKEFDLYQTPVHQTEMRHWKLFWRSPKDTFFSGLSCFANFLALQERSLGLPQIRIINLKNLKNHTIQFPDAAYSVNVDEASYEYSTQNLRVVYSSPITPHTLFSYDMEKKIFQVLKQKDVTGHRKEKYVTERVWVKSHDGTKVPMVLTYKKGLKRNGKNPVYLYGYGSYGANIPNAFPAHRDLYRLIDRGCIYALAHIRGGGEMGQKWYQNGKFLKKQNTFKDFIACAEWLHDKKYSAPEKTVIAGGSAGGMLVGACANMRPDLYKLVIAHVPFVDVINTMLDDKLPLTQLEYKEWGHPKDKKYFKYMLSYSPYDNVKPQNYPEFFVTCGLNDPRVTYWEATKWVAKLRKLKTDQNRILFKTNMGAGHFGASGRFEHLWENAEEYAVIISALGMTS